MAHQPVLQLHGTSEAAVCALLKTCDALRNFSCAMQPVMGPASHEACQLTGRHCQRVLSVAYCGVQSSRHILQQNALNDCERPALLL